MNSTPDKQRARRNIENPTPDKPGSILIGDSTRHVRMVKTEDITMADKSVREVTVMLPVIFSTHPNNRNIVIHNESFYILQRKNALEISKKDFCLLLEKLSDCQSQQILISGLILTLGKGIKSLRKLLALST